MSRSPGLLAPRTPTGSLLDVAPVVPVVSVTRVADAVPLARALVAGGVPVIELTLRTPVALAAMEEIAAHVPEILLGAGTVTTPAEVLAARAAGARFLVSPGATPALLEAMLASSLPFLPGVASVSEALLALELGCTDLKLFPAQAVGGVALLRAIAGPLPHVRFCPTGGITAADAPSYLALPNVGCVGGSWLTPPDVVAAGDWARVTELARAAAALG